MALPGMLNAQNDVREIVTIGKLTATGTRLQLRSIIAMTGLREGQKVDQMPVVKACTRLTDSGLVANVEYNYESLDQPKTVALELKITDVVPLLPATINIKGVDQEEVWKDLLNIDPLFAPELPRTEKALALYARYIERYLKTMNREDRVGSEVPADKAGNAKAIVFIALKTMGSPKPRK